MKHENYDIFFPDQPVVDLYLPIWAKLPAFRAKPAFIWHDDTPIPRKSTLTYAHLDASVQSISSHLRHSLGRGDTVVILCAPGLEFVEIIFACQRAGLRAVPVVPPHPSFDNGTHHHLVRVLSQTRPKAAIAASGYINSAMEYASSHDDRISSLLNQLMWIATEEIKDGNGDIDEQRESSELYRGCRADDVYLIQYTSGATAIPKPVLVTAGAAAHNVRLARCSYDLHPNSIIVSWLPQYHDCGLMFLLLTIVSGATCVLTSPNAFIVRPRLWLELITEFNATCTPVPSFTLPLVVKRGGVGKGTSTISLGSLKNLIIISEPIYFAPTYEFVKTFKMHGLDPASISPSYGLAENCTFVSTAWRRGNIANLPTHNNLLPSAKLPSSLQDEEITILVVNEETNELVDDGTEGEIWISSPSNAIGYLDHPDLTRDTFHARLRSHITSESFVRTGDRGVVIGQERYLYVMGRCSDIIRIRNERVTTMHAHFVETSAYKSSPKFLRPGCLAAFEYSKCITIVAELQRPVEDQATLSEVCNRIRNAVGVSGLTVVLVTAGSIPKTTSGKVQRWAVRIQLEKGQMNVVMRKAFVTTTTNTRNLGLSSSL